MPVKNSRITTKRRLSIAAFRSIVIKGVISDLKIVQILSEMTDIWIGTNGASYENCSLC
jgi:hypothetical protein